MQYLKGSVAKRDDRVKKGEKIASVGLSRSPAASLTGHFEIREKNKARNLLCSGPEDKVTGGASRREAR